MTKIEFVIEGTPTLMQVELSYIRLVLEKHNGNKAAAARELGVSLKTMYNKVNRYFKGDA